MSDIYKMEAFCRNCKQTLLWFNVGEGEDSAIMDITKDEERSGISGECSKCKTPYKINVGFRTGKYLEDNK